MSQGERSAPETVTLDDISCPVMVLWYYKYNTNKNLYSAVIRKNESEALFGPLGGKQVSFKFGFKVQ